MVYAPGYYKINYRGLRLRELIRKYGSVRGLRNYVLTRFMPPRAGVWMPGLWSDSECKPEDLPAEFSQATESHRLAFERLSFNICGFAKLTKSLSPFTRNSSAVRYLDSSRRQFGQLHYHRLYSPRLRKYIPRLVIKLTVAFEHGDLSCTNHTGGFDPLEDSEVIRLPINDVALVHRYFVKRLEQRQETPRHFPDAESLRQWFDQRQVRVFEERARRRLFIPMTDAEVAAARTTLSNLNRTP